MRFLRFGFLFGAVGLAACTVVPARGGDFKKPYFEATGPGTWTEYTLTSPDGSKSEFSYEREVDDGGRMVIEMRVKILEGPGKGTKVKHLYTLPEGFDFARQGMNFGKFVEKMTMNYSGADIPVDENTLKSIRDSEKDFRGAVTFEASETMEGRQCDRYAYEIRIGGPSPQRESGTLWLDPTLPFGMVRQKAAVTNEDGKPATEFDMRLTGTGRNQAIAEAAATPPPVAEKPAAPSNVSLKQGFAAGYVGIDVEAVGQTAGKRLNLTLVNKTENELAVDVPSGDLEIPASSPVDVLKISVGKTVQVKIPAGGSARPFEVGQGGTRGIVEGRCSLSVYEGTPLYSGSVTKGTLSK